MSTLTLTVLRSPDHVPAQQRQVQGGELTIGRSAECGWPLPDPLKSLSRKHCTLEFSGGSWQVRDLSVNGTFVNALTAPVGRDMVQPLHDGDRLLLGDYEIEVHLDEATYAAPAPRSLDLGRSPFDDTPRPGFAAARLPGLDDPLDMSPGFGRPSLAEDVMPDHTPSSSDAFVPPPMVPGGGGKQLVPDDWFREIDPGPAAAPLFAPTPAPLFAPAPERRPSEPFGVPPVDDPFGQTLQPVAAARPSGAVGELDLAFATAGLVVPAPAPMRPVPAASPAASGGDMAAALSALMAGSDLPPDLVARAAADPEAALRNAGALLRAAVAGIRALLIARGSVKREFRIEQTMLRSKENNPLKFAASDEQALAALLDPRAQAHALHAVEESISDLTLHQVATLAATQAAARALFEQMGPDKLEAEVTGGGFLPGALDKRRWEAYKRRHARLLEQFEDDFESAFGTAFARAYEQAVDRGKT